MYADFKLKFNLQCHLFEYSRSVYSSVPIQPLRSHRLDPARPMSMHGPLHGCSARPNLEAAIADALELLYQTANDLWTIRVGISYFNRANLSHHNLNSLLTVGILWPFLILLEDEQSDTQLHR